MNNSATKEHTAKLNGETSAKPHAPNVSFKGDFLNNDKKLFLCDQHGQVDKTENVSNQYKEGKENTNGTTGDSSAYNNNANSSNKNTLQNFKNIENLCETEKNKSLPITTTPSSMVVNSTEGKPITVVAEYPFFETTL